MKKILIFVDHYLPGNKHGGPVRTISNLVGQLSEYEFYIFTADRDTGDAKPYDSVARECWILGNNAKIYYSSCKSLRSISMRIKEVSPDLVCLNSFFSRVTIKLLWVRRFGAFQELSFLLAPRGEFAPGALDIKPRRKRLYIRLVNAIGILDGVTLQASSDFEKEDIEKHLKLGTGLANAQLWVAPDLPSLNESVPGNFKRDLKKPGTLRAIFLARISRNKNLDGALRMISSLKGNVIFSICGPIGDPVHWLECRELISSLPPNIAVREMGNVPHDQALQLLAQNDVLLLPTQGENYGHSIIESLLAGCPVVISDRTPWRNLERERVGADISLAHAEKFSEFLQRFVDMGNAEFMEWSLRARNFGRLKAIDPKPLQQNRGLFDSLLKGKG